jgi:hypothetical protein
VTLPQDVLIAYGRLFNEGVDRVTRGVDNGLLIAIAHGGDFQSIRFAGGDTKYRQSSDQYKADALSGTSSDGAAQIITKKIRGRDNVTVLVADHVDGETSGRDLKKVAERLANNLTAILKDAKLQ